MDIWFIYMDNLWIFYDILVGGWLNPSEKYESHLGWWFPKNMKNTKNVPNHPPVIFQGLGYQNSQGLIFFGGCQIFSKLNPHVPDQSCYIFVGMQHMFRHGDGSKPMKWITVSWGKKGPSYSTFFRAPPRDHRFSSVWTPISIPLPSVISPGKFTFPFLARNRKWWRSITRNWYLFHSRWGCLMGSVYQRLQSFPKLIISL